MKTYTDFRELLDQEEIEIAIVATPDHWHALNTLAAIEAGAHIFVEKPTGHTIGKVGYVDASACQQPGRAGWATPSYRPPLRFGNGISKAGARG